MSRDDNMLASALWLVAGGAAGYAAGRIVVGPWLASRPKLPSASSSSVAATVPAPRPTVRATRALPAGPSGTMQPIDPYGSPVIDVATAPPAGPSGDMRPIDPYGDATPSIAPVATTPTTPPTISTPIPVDGPVTRPPELPIVASPTTSGPVTRPPELPIVASPITSGPVTRPSEVPSGPPSIASGPITTPSQIDTVRPTELTAPAKPVTSSEQAPRAAFATKPRVRRFDAVFERYRGEIPIEYVRALVERESDGHPAVRTGSAIGLMQIVPVVLADYNKRHGKAIRSEQLVAPAVNVAIGCDLLRLIIASYRKHHPRIPSLQADWNNPRFVELLTFGWNAGFSEAGGLGRVARYLEQLGARDIDVDLVAAHARIAGATKHLSNPAKLAWSKIV
ncbi:MAG: transglycosylase SLT domain-containing protein, partial [Kofleriaceae bacterium]